MTTNDPIREEIMRATGTDMPPQKVTMAYALFTALLLDLPLSPAQTTDFGVDTADHYRALRDSITAEVNAGTSVPETIIGMARRLGNGPALTAWTQTHWPDAPVFTTAYDGLGDPEQGDPEQYPFDDERRPHP